METLTDRRTTGPLPDRSFSRRDTTSIVREGILLRTYLGTIGAIEYLKNHDIEGGVITRVLTGTDVRDEDNAALSQREVAHPLPV